jgi:hypothetical protein
VSATEPAQLVWLRTNDACTIAWCAGVLPGKAVKIAAPKAPKKRASDPLAELRKGSRAKRIAAATALATSTDPAVIEALLVVSVSDADHQVRGPAFDAFRKARAAAAAAGTPFDLVPIARARLAVLPDFDGSIAPEPHYADAAVLERCLGELTVEKLERADVRALYGEVAWKRRLGVSTTNCATTMVGLGHAESIERASHLVHDATYGIAAMEALFRLPPDVGVPRARQQFDAGTDEQKRDWASSFLHAARGGDPAFLELLVHVAAHLPEPRQRMLSEWVVKAGVIEKGRRDSLAARALFRAHYWGPEHDALLAQLPDAALDEAAAYDFVSLARKQPGLEATAARFSTAALVVAVRRRMAETDWFTVPYEVGKVLLDRRAEDPSLVALVTEWSEIAKQRDDHSTGHQLDGLLAAL